MRAATWSVAILPRTPDHVLPLIVAGTSAAVVAHRVKDARLRQRLALLQPATTLDADEQAARLVARGLRRLPFANIQNVHEWVQRRHGGLRPRAS